MQLYGQKYMPPTRKYLYKKVRYKATVKTNNSVKHYIGATEGTIKQNWQPKTIFQKQKLRI